jgi:hypothetical protein
MNTNTGKGTSYYGVEGSITPIFSCGAVRLAPSFLTGNGSHLVLWVSVIIHIIAVGLNTAANIAFFVNSGDTAADVLMGWAICSMTMHTIAVIGTVLSTAFVKDVFSTPLVNTLGFALFMGGLMATLKASYTHGAAQPANSVENVNYNLSLLFQAFGVASLLSNALCALAGIKATL